MGKILVGTVASLFLCTAAYAEPPSVHGTDIADRASHVAADHGAPGRASTSTDGAIDSGHAFGESKSGNAGQSGSGQGGGAQSNR